MIRRDSRNIMITAGVRDHSDAPASLFYPSQIITVNQTKIIIAKIPS